MMAETEIEHYMKQVVQLKAENAALLAECERHRRANLVRAVLNGADPEWIGDLIASGQFDAVPWRIAERSIQRAPGGEG